MIENAHQIGDDRPALQAPFQEQILAHWHQIQKNRRFPDKRDFRPQMFPKFLPQLAIVAVSGNETYENRLVGTAISEVLHLNSAHDGLTDSNDTHIGQTVKTMLGTAAKSDKPMYFRGKFTREQANPIDFTALVLPFSHNGDADILDTLLLAFEFGRTPFNANSDKTSPGQ